MRRFLITGIAFGALASPVLVSDSGASAGPRQFLPVQGRSGNRTVIISRSVIRGASPCPMTPWSLDTEGEVHVLGRDVEVAVQDAHNVDAIRQRQIEHDVIADR